jgi:hypothetical protein
MVVVAAALVLAVLLLVLPASRSLAWTLAVVVAALALLSIRLRTRQLARAHAQSAQVLAALGATTADLPVSLRTRMPLVLVMGDALAQVFKRDDTPHGESLLVHVGCGAIWLQVKRPQDLPRLAIAVKQWRDGRAPDGVVLTLAPALYADEEALRQRLREVRQAASDASRLLGARLPRYIAVYQRLTSDAVTPDRAQWYGVSATRRLTGTQRFEAVIQAAETEVQRAHSDPQRIPQVAARAAGLAYLIGWTQRFVIGTLTGCALGAFRRSLDRLRPSQQSGYAMDARHRSAHGYRARRATGFSHPVAVTATVDRGDAAPAVGVAPLGGIGTRDRARRLRCCAGDVGVGEKQPDAAYARRRRS